MESYTGKVQAMGMSMFMQGSHELVDDKGNMIVLLQAATDQVNLKSFEGKKAKVSGTTEDTVEAGGKIVSVVAIESA